MEDNSNNNNSQLRTRHRYYNNGRHHIVVGGGHQDEIPGDGGHGGGVSRGRERYRRQRREQSRSPSQPPGTCPVGCSTMYYMLWIVLGFVVYPFVAMSTTPDEETLVYINDSGSSSSTIMMKKQKKTFAEPMKRLKVPRRPPSHDQIRQQEQSLQFVFIAGLPGPNHGILHDLIVKSPLELLSNSGSSMSHNIQLLQDLLWPRSVPLTATPQTESTNSLNATILSSSSSSSLSNHHTYGLWNAHCSKDEMTVDLTTILDEIILRLQTIRRIYLDNNNNNNNNSKNGEQKSDNNDKSKKKRSQNDASSKTTSNETVPISRIPINVLLPLQKNGGSPQQGQRLQEDDFSYMTYPNGFTNVDTDPTSGTKTETVAPTSCRPLDHPNLDLLFHACDVADVDCKLMFVHQPPTNALRHQQQQLKLIQNQQQQQTEIPGMLLQTTALSSPTISTRTLLPIIHLLTSMLSILTTDMVLFSERIISCLDMDGRITTKERGGGESWSDTIFKLFWTDKASMNSVSTSFDEDTSRRKQFDALLKSAISQHIAGVITIDDFVPKQFDPYMNAYRLASDRAVEICEDLLKENR